MSFRNILKWFTAIATSSLAVGCFSSTLTPPETVPVAGAVICEGKPVPGVRVKFHPQFDMGKVQFVPYGETGEDGKFVLNTGAPGNGAPRGNMS